MRIVLAQINPTIGDLSGNTQKIVSAIADAKKRQADVVLFPELCVSGYPPDDFLLMHHFIEALRQPLNQIQAATKGITAIVGAPRQEDSVRYNSAWIFSDGKLMGIEDKVLLPTYDVFAERRYFRPGTAQRRLWNIAGKKVAITICEDIWQHSALLTETTYAIDPVKEIAVLQPELLLNLSASPYSFSKKITRTTVCCKAASTLGCPLLLCNQVGGNDGLIFDGHSLHLDGKGQVLHCAKGFEEDQLLIDLSQPAAPIHIHDDPLPELYQALVLGVRDYFHKSGFKKACLGLSGGIDSALVACIAVDALGKENVLAIAMPSRFSTTSSLEDARFLAKKLGIAYREISIEKPFESYLDLLNPEFEGKPWDVAEENIQARIRGMILMALSNKLGYIVLSTGNKSEMAMGYATLYGDMCGGLGVINDVTKRQVYALSRWINRNEEIIPWNTITKPPSAELRPDQKDADTLPDYEIVDNVLEDYVQGRRSPQEIADKWNYPLELVNDLIKRIHRNEYKRRQSPPGLRVTEKAFSVGRRFPIVQRWV